MICAGEKRFLVDVGPDFRQQMLRYGFKRIDAILLTHEHNDHISGLDDVRPVNFRQQSDIPVYGLERVLQAVTRRFDYVFDPAYKYPGLPKLTLKALNPGNVVIEDLPIRVLSVMHGPLEVLGFRIEDFCYITDAKTIPDDQMPFLEGLETLVINALHRKPHFSHLNLDEALLLIDRIAPKQTFLTHLSHDMGCHADVQAELPPHVSLAYDGLSISVHMDESEWQKNNTFSF
jgi:phosphoribosyl 1,2-cyclic phosphate phosphodiesterase